MAAARSRGSSWSGLTTRRRAVSCSLAESFGLVPRRLGVGQRRVDQTGVDRPAQKSAGDLAGGGTLCLPGVEVCLLKVLEFDAAVVQPVENSIATVTACLARRNVPCVTVSMLFIRRW
jgi:hypothetical protein